MGVLDQNGNQIVPTPEFLASALAWYRAKLLSQLGPEKRSEFEASEKRAREGLKLEGQSQLVFDARMVDWLLANAGESEDISSIKEKLNAVKYALEWQLPKSDDMNVPQYEKKFGPDPQLLERLKSFGFADDGMQVLPATTSSGAAYVAECEANGVPIPPPIGELDPDGLRGWKSQGFLPPTKQFIVMTQAEVMTYHSSSPEGLCIALPRSSPNNPSEIAFDGVICLGKVSSKVCFWDNQMQQKTFPFPAGKKIPIGSPNLAINPDGEYMAGGAELWVAWAAYAPTAMPETILTLFIPERRSACPTWPAFPWLGKTSTSRSSIRIGRRTLVRSIHQASVQPAMSPEARVVVSQ